jgi:hypothetical protein
VLQEHKYTKVACVSEFIKIISSGLKSHFCHLLRIAFTEMKFLVSVEILAQIFSIPH